MPETIYWTVVNLENNVSMGIISLMKRVNFDSYDLGFAFLDEFLGKDYAFEASMEVVRFFKLKTEITSIIAITLHNNESFIRLLKN